MNKSEIAERENFEKWAKGPKLPLECDGVLYSEYITEIAWLAWRERAIVESQATQPQELHQHACPECSTNYSCYGCDPKSLCAECIQGLTAEVERLNTKLRIATRELIASRKNHRAELGDGEPSPPVQELSFDQHADLLYSRNKWHMLCNGLSLNPAKSAVADVLKAVGGAAQEVSPPSPDAFQEAWAKYNKAGLSTGWERVGFVGGFKYGFDAGRKSAEGDTRELKAALKALVDKLKIILPKVDGFIGLASLRAGQDLYDGPNIAEEMKEAERLLG